VPFYGFGTLQVVAKYDIGSLGPAEGSAVQIDIPVRDSFRSVFLWFVLLALLLRKPNWNRQAWAILPVLGAIFLILHVAQSYVNAHVLFYVERHICSILCEMLRSLAGAIAVLLAMSDRIVLRNRLFRFLLVFLILFAAGAGAIYANQPIIANAVVWIVVFGIFLLLFLVGHAIFRALLRTVRRFSSPRPRARTTNLLAWSAGISLLLGIAPAVAFAIAGSILSRSVYLLSTLEALRMVITLSHAVLGPYLVLFWFLLLALWIPLYRERLTHAFGSTPILGL
jgi:hypothetical protein